MAPRYSTPRNPDRRTLGPEVAAIAQRLGTPLMPWQQLVVDVALEFDDDGRFVYGEVDLTVPRQSGKTTLIRAKTVHRLVRLARTLGPQRSTYTAQTRLAARKKLEQDFAEALRASRSFREVPHSRARPHKATEWRLSLNNGTEHIQFGTGSFWQIDAPSRTGGHGDTLDDGTIDEAFKHETDEVEASMRPAQATRRNAQLWVLSTAGDGRSRYLWRKVKAGREATELGVHGKVAYFEWSAPDDADPSDPAVWWACSPALGHTISEDFIASEWERAQRKGQEGVDTFRRAYLNQWPEIPVLDDEELEFVLPAEAWAAALAPGVGIDGTPSFALDVSQDRAWAAVGAAGRSTLDGSRVAVEVVASRQGTAWVVDFAQDLLERWGGELSVAKGSPAAALIPDLVAAGVPVDEVSAEDQTRDCGQLYDAVVEGRIHRPDQPVLEVAVRGAAKQHVGDAWRWSRRRSSVDISPLVAVTLAAGHHGLTAPPVDEDWDLLVLE